MELKLRFARIIYLPRGGVPARPAQYLECLVHNAGRGLVEQDRHDNSGESQCRRVNHTCIAAGKHRPLGGPDRQKRRAKPFPEREYHRAAAVAVL